MRRCLLSAAMGAALLLLAAAPAAHAHSVVTDPAQCISCHQTLTPGIVTQYQNGAMGDGGAGATCIGCHTTDPTGGQVPASRCASCHVAQYNEFTARDAQEQYVNKHAIGWTKMTASARYMVMPQEQRHAMCERCHDVGEISGDGSIGKCDSCHTRHVFSIEEAREPETCGACHMGPGHEQIDMWEQSKHGVVYRTEQMRAGGHPERAPTCVTCHMPQKEKGVGNPLIHNVSTNLTLGTTAQGARVTGTALSVPMRTISLLEFYERRDKMESVCKQCHSVLHATESLEGADEIKRDVDELLWDPVMRIRGLWYDGLLDPMPLSRPANPAYAALDNGQILVLGGQQLYGDTSRIEQSFFSAYEYDQANTFKGAYHFSPDYSHWYGWAKVNQDVDIVRGEETSLRSLADPGFKADFRGVVGQNVVFDASALLAWGNPSFNTFAWWFGDGSSLDPAPETFRTTHKYTAVGVYRVRLTVSDSDNVNNVLAPDLCSAKRTTSARVEVKYGATLALAKIKRVAAGRTVTVKGTFTTGDAVTGTVLLWAQAAGGSWKQVATKNVTTTADTPLALTFKRTLTRATRFWLVFWGDANTWDALSPMRTVTPL